MTFDVEIDGMTTRLEVQRDGEDCRFRLGKTGERHAQLTEVEPGVYSVLLDGRSYEARAETGEDCAWIDGTHRQRGPALSILQRRDD